MKASRFSDYLTPQVYVVNVSVDGILCASKSEGFGINNMDIVTGGEGSDWDWDI